MKNIILKEKTIRLSKWWIIDPEINDLCRKRFNFRKDFHAQTLQEYKK